MGNLWPFPRSCLSSSLSHPFPIQTCFCFHVCILNGSVFGMGVLYARVLQNIQKSPGYYSSNSTINAQTMLNTSKLGLDFFPLYRYSFS